MHKLPVYIILGIGFMVGVIVWLPHAKQLELLAQILILLCGLWWAIGDARMRKVPLGNWLGLLILVIQPIGLIFWFLKVHGIRFYIPLLYYIGIIILTMLLSIVSFLIIGLIKGNSFDSLLNRL